MLVRNKHLLIIDYAGDYREAYERLQAGGMQTYFAQRYSITVVAEALSDFEKVTLVVCQTSERYDQILDNGVRVIGLGLNEHPSEDGIIDLITQIEPTHIMFRTLFPKAIKWAAGRYENIACIFYNSLTTRGRLRWFENRAIRKVLNSSRVRWVFAYGMASAQEYVRAGVDPAKVVPFDFLYDLREKQHSPLTLPTQNTPRIMYVGRIKESKGVGDLLDAVALLRKDGFEIELGIAGYDAKGHFAAQSVKLGIAEDVTFYGLVDNDCLEEKMREHQAIVVPSHKREPEGFPLVIAQALRARVPVVVSNHPMFIRSLTDRQTAMVFRERQPEDLASAIRNLLVNPMLFSSLSEAATEALEAIAVPIKPKDIFAGCFAQRPGDNGYLASNSLAAIQSDGGD